MNFDHELKQRLIGALVVTILSAIFIPMLFDDSIEEEGQAVTTLELPSENQFVEEPAIKAPASSEQVLEIPKQPQVEPAAIALTSNTSTPALENTLAKNSLRPDEMEDAVPVAKLQPKPAPKPKVEKPVYSETTNYGVKPPEEIDDEPPMKPKAEVKKGENKNEDALLKQIRAAKLLDDTPAVKTTTPSVEVNATDVKKVLTSEQPKKAGRWFIQLASLTNKAKAETLQEGLKAQGLPATLTTIQNDKGTFYRLRVGPELDGKRAAAMKRKMDEQGISSILVSE